MQLKSANDRMTFHQERQNNKKKKKKALLEKIKMAAKKNKLKREHHSLSGINISKCIKRLTQGERKTKPAHY